MSGDTGTVTERRLSRKEAREHARQWDQRRAFVAQQGHAGHRFQSSWQSTDAGDAELFWCDDCAQPIGFLNIR